MPDVHSILCSTHVKWLAKWIIYPAGGLVLLTILQTIISHVVEQYIPQLENKTAYGITVLSQWTNSELISLGLTIIIIGLVASWQVNRAQDNEKKARQEYEKYRADVRKKFMEYIDHATSKLQYIEGSCKFVWNEESIEHQISQLPLGKEKAEELFKLLK